MVKGKLPVKSMQQKKSTQAQAGRKPANVTTGSPAAVDVRKHRASSPVPACCGCGQIISDDGKALQCDRCQGDQWKCVDCLGITVTVYEQLVADPACCLRWFCDDCDKAVMVGQDNAKKGGEDQIEKLVHVVEKLVERLTHADDKLDHKCERSELDHIEARLKSIEDRASNSEMKLEQRLGGVDEYVKLHVTDKTRTLEEKLDKLSSLVDDTRKEKVWTDMKVKDCIAKAVEVKSTEDDEEKKEREKRKTSVIIHGVAESTSIEPQEREDDDVGVVASMLQEIKCSDVNVNNVIRLGRRPLSTDDQETSVTRPKPRPIKMVVNTEEEKFKVLKSAKNLRLSKEGGWEKIFIHQDLTFKEREERRFLLQEKKTREQRGETDLIIVGKKIVKQYKKIDEQLEPATHNSD